VLIVDPVRCELPEVWYAAHPAPDLSLLQAGNVDTSNTARFQLSLVMLYLMI
jgi:hypothetical protein